MKRPDPKNCPCCDYNVIYIESTATDGSVRCTKCGLKMVQLHSQLVDDGLDKALAAWNTRLIATDIAIAKAHMREAAALVARKAHAAPPPTGPMDRGDIYSYAVRHGEHIASTIEQLT